MDTMPTKHCPDCEPDSPCGGGHVYVIELGHDIKLRFPHRTALYVGQTQNTVDRRMQSNLMRSDRKTVVTIEEARANPGGDDWRWPRRSGEKIRRHYVRHRPDLYAHLNPLEKDEDVLKAAERKLSRELGRVKENGLIKYDIHGDGRKKRRRKKKKK